MRSAIFLFAVAMVAAGCAPGRQVAVSNDGRIASVAEAGTYVAGRGKVTDGGKDLSWSPDGQLLAIDREGETELWPTAKKFPGLTGPLAWSPFGDELIGRRNGRPIAINIESGLVRVIDFGGEASRYRTFKSGELLSMTSTELATEEGKHLERPGAMILDAICLPDGLVAWIEIDRPGLQSGLYGAILKSGRWNPADGATTVQEFGTLSELLNMASNRKLGVPTQFALAPDGDRIAVGGFVLETSPRNIERLRVLGAKPKLTMVEQAEAKKILVDARRRSAVVRLNRAGAKETLWSDVLSDEADLGVTDLEWSPEGTWLAIGRRDGTLRVAG